MKKLLSILVLIAAVVITSCAKYPDLKYNPTQTVHGYSIITNGITGLSSVTLGVNQNLAIYVKDSLGNTVLAKVQFGNGLELIGYQMSGQYTTNGTYYLTATVLNITKVVILHLTVTVTTNSANSAYSIKVNSNLSNDTARVLVNTPVTIEVVNSTGQSVYSDLYFGNGSSALNQLSATYTYPSPGKFKITANVRSDGSTSYRYIVVQQTNSMYTVTINGQAQVYGGTYTTLKGTLLNFKVLDGSGNVQVADIDFGTGNKVFGVSNMPFTYSTVGTFNFIATTNGQTIPIKIVVSDNPTTSDAVTIISISYANGLNSVSLGLRCDAISSFNPQKDTKVWSEMRNNSAWPPGEITLTSASIVTINNVKYYQWSFSCVNGNIRFGWHQDNNWAWTYSIFSRTVDNLYGQSIINGSIGLYQTAI